ncbi:hypothetical protein CDAR_165041 [Caerostris darwini]|uniref:Uncharacterized protein n=1 Tax=Caerostris darwini TaxID=1538125 RepID=A0AAV4NYB8_9ARAC|nr:hypothetical protein CDAR_165041 [Caerostris darwini]
MLFVGRCYSREEAAVEDDDRRKVQHSLMKESSAFIDGTLRHGNPKMFVGICYSREEAAVEDDDRRKVKHSLMVHETRQGKDVVCWEMLFWKQHQEVGI